MTQQIQAVSPQRWREALMNDELYERAVFLEETTPVLLAALAAIVDCEVIHGILYTDAIAAINLATKMKT